jgi:hypothetical protein
MHNYIVHYRDKKSKLFTCKIKTYFICILESKWQSRVAVFIYFDADYSASLMQSKATTLQIVMFMLNSEQKGKYGSSEFEN